MAWLDVRPDISAAWACGVNQKGAPRVLPETISLALLPQIRSPGQMSWGARGPGVAPAHPGAVWSSCPLVHGAVQAG